MLQLPKSLKMNKILDIGSFWWYIYCMGINDNGYIRGLVGPLVSRKVGTKNYIQGKPHRVKQNVDTKNAGKDFGQASRAGAAIRQAFGLVHQALHDGQMGNRLNRQIYRAMKTNINDDRGTLCLNNCKLDRLVNFQFNENFHMQDALNIDPTVSLTDENQIEISFPIFHINRALLIPKDCNAIAFKFHTFSFNFKEREFTEVKDEEWEIDIVYGQDPIPAKMISIPCNEFVGTPILVGFTIIYLYKDGRRCNVLNEVDCTPATILAAFQL